MYGSIRAFLASSSIPLGSFALLHSAHRLPPSSPAAETAGVDDLVYFTNTSEICCKEEIEGDITNSNLQRKVLPPELQLGNVVKLTCESGAEGGICDVYLVGTGHDYRASHLQAQAIVKFLKPQVVFLQLCSDRLHHLTCQNHKVPTMGEMLNMWKQNVDPFRIFYEWHRAKLGSGVEIELGREFRLACVEAMRYGGKIVLGDRPDPITMQRSLTKMSIWKYLFHPYGVPKLLINMKAKTYEDRRDLIYEELSKKYPTYMEINVFERDRYMSANILRIACEHSSVVVVVDWRHLPGIQKNWKQPIDMKQLLDTKKETFTIGKILSWMAATICYTSISPRTVLAIRSAFVLRDFQHDEPVV